MHTKIDERLDKSGSPWYSPVKKDSFINDAIIEFLQTRADVFEKDERRKQDLAKLTKKYTNAALAYINVEAITDFVRVASIIGVFSHPTCAGHNITRPVRPIQMDDLGDTLINPLTKPTNRWPRYTEYNDGTMKPKIEIYSDNTPVSLVMYYISLPATVNSQSTPKVDCDLPVYTHNEIIDIAVRKMMMPIQSQNYPLQQNEINQSQ